MPLPTGSGDGGGGGGSDGVDVGVVGVGDVGVGDVGDVGPFVGSASGPSEAGQFSSTVTTSVATATSTPVRIQCFASGGHQFGTRGILPLDRSHV